jgi:predicted TIM-barrel fold metal-dependent hydrolase
MLRTVDADAHVLETERTFAFMDEADRKYAPTVWMQTGGMRTAANDGSNHNQHWLVDGRVLNKDKNKDSSTPETAREMSDVDSRLKHMDELEIDVQVLYPTIFLRPVTQRSKICRALTQSYNRWLAEIWKKGHGRLRWVAMPPLLSMQHVADELAWAKDNGACGVFLNGLECERLLSDPYFYPLYEEAEKLDLPLCVHAGINSMTVHDFFADSSFSQFKLSVIGAFHTLIMEGVPSKFPKARWAFIEVSSQWIPYVLNDLSVRFRKRGRRLPKNVLQDYNMYVACQVTDDLPMVLPYSGEDNLVIGTDYGHSDTSSEIEALRLLKTRSNIPGTVIDKILGPNPCRLYGL